MRARLRALGAGDLSRVESFLQRTPIQNLFLASKLLEFGLDRRRLGRLYAFERSGEITSLCLDGGTLFVTGADPEALGPYVRAIGGYRRATSILGPADAALPLFEALRQRWHRSWGRVSNVRASQPLMCLDKDPLPTPDARVRRIELADFSSYLGASVHMYTEEIGSSPFKYGGGYDAFVRDRIVQGDAWGIVQDGEVIFKADLGPKVPGHAQLQGVWVHPDLRGQGLAVPALSGMLALARRYYPLISLYVNDFNAPALRSYDRLGFTRVGALATVHY